MARRKVKNGEKSPWGQCLTRPVPTVAAVLASDWCQKTCETSEGVLSTAILLLGTVSLKFLVGLLFRFPCLLSKSRFFLPLNTIN